MSNFSISQIIMDAQLMANRVKDLDTLSSALLVEAEGNNRLVESLRQYQDDLDSLNRISNNKSNAEMVNRIQQQNANSSEIIKENRELKICIEDYERAMEIIMQKYREHSESKVLESKINFKSLYNEKLWTIIRQQREKINEMAAVMQRAASVDDDVLNQELEHMSRLKYENKALRELLHISNEFGSAGRPIILNDHLLDDKSVQTELIDDSSDDLSLSGASIENMNNNSVIALNASGTTVVAADAVSPNVTAINFSNNGLITTIYAREKSTRITGGENNNSPIKDQNDDVINAQQEQQANTLLDDGVQDEPLSLIIEKKSPMQSPKTSPNISPRDSPKRSSPKSSPRSSPSAHNVT